MDNQWRPIEEAPKDGTRILAAKLGNHPETGDPFAVGIAHWHDDKHGWQEDDFDPDEYASEWGLTHFMPLPPPPKGDVE